MDATAGAGPAAGTSEARSTGGWAMPAVTAALYARRWCRRCSCQMPRGMQVAGMISVIASRNSQRGRKMKRSIGRSIAVGSGPFVLLDRVAPVDHDRLARHVARALAGKEGDHLGNFVGSPGATQRRVAASGGLGGRLRCGGDP